MTEKSATNRNVETNRFTLTDKTTGQSFELDGITGSEGPSVIDIRSLYPNSDLFTFDPGYTSTASCESEITYIDGNRGILLYRGYTVEDLAANSDYLDVCYLLLYGDLPSPEEKQEFDSVITTHTMLHDQLISFFRGFIRDAHPMAFMIGIVGALSAFYHDQTDINDPKQRMNACHRLISKMPTIGAYAYKYSLGQPFVYPSNELGYAENLLKMMFAVPTETYEVNPVLAKAMDQILILHADHEQNASTSTVRLTGSSGANPFACIAAGIASLWGPAHGGANEAVVEMLKEIGDISNIPKYIERAKNPDDPFRLMGFGHRVYKNYDPRARVLKGACDAVLKELGIENDPLLDTALELEDIALNDDYFTEKQLYPNVDFYSGIILKAMGIPTNMFTVIFAIGRTVGWIAHWKEMISGSDRKIGRPRQLYTGQSHRDFTAVDVREHGKIHGWSWRYWK